MEKDVILKQVEKEHDNIEDLEEDYFDIRKNIQNKEIKKNSSTYYQKSFNKENPY